MNDDNKLACELYDWLGDTWIIDAHEHIPSEAERLAMPIDVVTMFEHYTLLELRVSVMSHEQYKRMVDVDKPLDERWSILRQYLPYIKNTSHARSHFLGVREMYGFDDINDNNYLDVNEAILEANKPGLYRRVFREHGKIVAVLNQPFVNQWEVHEPGNFRFFQVPEDGLTPGSGREFFVNLEQNLGLTIHSLADAVAALPQLLGHYKDRGALGIKLKKDYVLPCPEAATVRPWFDKLMRWHAHSPPHVFHKTYYAYLQWCNDGNDPAAHIPLSHDERQLLRAYFLHQIFPILDELEMSVIWHCGCRGLAKDYRPTNPEGLIPLFQKYPNIRFELYHGGFPWARQTAMIGKSFANVWLNFCWAHSVSSHMTRTTINEWLDMVPVNKIIAFGGDTIHWVEWALGDLAQARQNFALVMAGRIRDGICTEEEAKFQLRTMFYNSAKDLYRLDVDPKRELAYI